MARPDWKQGLTLLALAAILGAPPAPAPAQQAGSTPALPATASTPGPATLVADKVQIEAGHSLLAEGHVEVFYKGTRMTASRVRYDKAKDRLFIEGPIRLIQPDGTVVLADSAELSTDLRDGLMRSARMVLDRQLQLAAAQINRVGGRYTQLTRTVASSCEVCAGHPTPLWEIRASRVIHDQRDHQLYFDNATLRLAGVPVFYLPRLRMPDPTLKRATGFLRPTFRNSSLLGTGISVPYFIAMGPSRDLTLTPYVASRTRTLGLRYRQAFDNGRLSFTGAISNDDLGKGDIRGYLFGTGDFAVGRGYRLSFDLQASSDKSYLSNYGISGTDRLQSDIALTRVSRSQYTGAQLYAFRSLRAGEINSIQPGAAAGYTRIHRFHPRGIGGQATLSFDTFGLVRTSNLDILGRDMARASVRLDWRRSWVLNPGIVVSALARATTDIYAIHQDSNWPDTLTRTVPEAALELRWPFVRTEKDGATQLLEPIVQLIAGPRSVALAPNEDSTTAELDSGDLWSLGRYPGYDAIEYGPRANIGLRWTRTTQAGYSLGVVAGRVFRAEASQDFTTGSGLGGARSDWLTGVQWTTPKGLQVTGRALLGDSLGVTKAEARLAWVTPRFGLATSYVWMVADTAENRPDPTEEWAMNANWNMSGNWSGNANWRYDFQAERATSAGLGLNWHNECLAVDLSLSRSFTSSTSVTATTTFGLSVDLIGISGRATTGSSGRCSG